MADDELVELINGFESQNLEHKSKDFLKKKSKSPPYFFEYYTFLKILKLIVNVIINHTEPRRRKENGIIE